MDGRPCPDCGARMERWSSLLYCPVFGCETFGHGYSYAELDNIRVAACERRLEARQENPMGLRAHSG